MEYKNHKKLKTTSVLVKTFLIAFSISLVIAGTLYFTSMHDKTNLTDLGVVAICVFLFTLFVMVRIYFYEKIIVPHRAQFMKAAVFLTLMIIAFAVIWAVLGS